MKKLILMILNIFPLLTRTKQSILFASISLLPFLWSCSERQTSAWISGGDNKVDEFSQQIYINDIDLIEVPDSFIVNVTAFHIYKLFVNGQKPGFGPQRNAGEHRKYDSYNLAPYLKTGKNTIKVEVIYWGKHSGQAFPINGTKFWFNCPADALLNTPGSWRAYADSSLSVIPVVNTVDVRGGFLAPACDSVHYKPYLNNKLPINLVNNFAIEPTKRKIPYPEQRIERFTKPVAQSEPLDTSALNEEKFSMQIAPNKKVSFLIDNKVLTNGYPQLWYSEGKGAKIKISYAESLFLKGQRDAEGKLIQEGQKKGNRNIFADKDFVGYYDVIMPDGGEGYFEPSWFRSFRYLKIDITTSSDTLIISDFYNLFTAYPFIQKASFTCDNNELNKIWKTSWRTARLCAMDTYMDCPYYEQLQYIGDTRIQAIITYTNTTDSLLPRNAIEQFAQSINDDGLTLAAYPSNGDNIIPPFSLFWTLMVSDYYAYKNDKDYVFSYLDKISNVFEWHLKYYDSNTHVLSKLPYWNFVDWPKQWAWDPEINTGGIPAGAKDGVSSILNMQFVYALQKLSPVFKDAGRNVDAQHYDSIAKQIKTAIYQTCWDTTENYLKDAPNVNEYSQHANILAVLTNTIKENKVPEFIERVALDTRLIQTTVYYRFYLFEALKKAHREDLYIKLLTPWTDMLKLGLTTFAEKPDPTRSDCHGWSASPNINFLDVICGIRIVNSEKRQLTINPTPGNLKFIHATYPIGNDAIYFSYIQDSGKFEISIPENVNADFSFMNSKQELSTGKNIIIINK